MSYEVLAGVMSLVFAVVATAQGQNVSIWHAAAAGMAGIFGAWVFINPETSTTRTRIVALLTGAGLASLFGPLLARAGGFYYPWVGDVNYFVTAAAGLFVGLVCTPILRVLHNPGPAISLLLQNMFSWLPKKKDP